MEINLKIKPSLTPGNDVDINYDLIKNKKIIGLLGYARSGKDSIGKKLIEQHGFKRISFGDILKIDLDNQMKEEVFEDLKRNNVFLPMEDIEFMFPKTIVIKEILRPYMKWFGEYMKKKDGIQHWVNRAFSEIGEAKKVIITDVRRVNELLPFYIDTANKHNFESVLFYVNQLGLTDKDSLTHDCIRVARENWLIEEEILVDSRIPDENELREKHIQEHVDNLSEKYSYFFA